MVKLMEESASRLSPAEGASCGPVGVGAVTGKSKKDVEDAIRRAVREGGGPDPGEVTEISFRHQARAVELLGFELFSDGHGIDGRSISPEVKRPHFCSNKATNISRVPARQSPRRFVIVLCP